MPKNIKAEVLQRAFAALEATHKRLTPEVIVRAAKDKRSPLHRHFTWDDKKAAHRHRLNTARELLTTYITVVIVTRKQKISVPIYVRDPALPPNVPGYISTFAKRTRAHAEAMLEIELDRIAGCVSRARELAKVLDLQHPGIAAKMEGLLDATVSAQQQLIAAE